MRLMPRDHLRDSEVCALIHSTGVPAPTQKILLSRSTCLPVGGLFPTRRAGQQQLCQPLCNQKQRGRVSVTARSSLANTREGPPSPNLIGNQDKGTRPEGRVSRQLPRNIRPDVADHLASPWDTPLADRRQLRKSTGSIPFSRLRPS